jgi:hypothetical protein
VFGYFDATFGDHCSYALDGGSRLVEFGGEPFDGFVGVPEFLALVAGVAALAVAAGGFTAGRSFADR